MIDTFVEDNLGGQRIALDKDAEMTAVCYRLDL